MGDRQEILRTVGEALAAAGYSRQGRAQVFTKPLHEDVLAWVGLMADRADDGVLEISPKVGVRHERLHRLVDRLAHRERSMAPTVSIILGYLMPEKTSSVVWRFDDPALYARQAQNMVDSISEFGEPYVRSNLNLETLIATLLESGVWEYARKRVPAAYVLEGDTGRPRDFLEAELEKLAGRDDPADDDFRAYAERFLAEIRPGVT
jgi:hypothetical protein